MMTMQHLSLTKKEIQKELEFFCVVAKELRELNFTKIVSLAPEVL
jgi:ribosomal protein L14